jgi:hypothetical protein
MRIRAVLLLCPLVSTVLSAEDEITIRPVQIVCQAAVPDGAMALVKQSGINVGYTIGFLIEGEHIIGINRDHLKIEHILTPDGKDISKTATGDPNYTLNPFPRFSADGKFGFFQLQSMEQAFGKVESLHVKGSIAIRTASAGVKNISLEHAFNGNASEELGGFTVTFGLGSREAGDRENEAALYQKKVVVTVVGPLETIANALLRMDQKEITYNGVSSGGNQRTYMFDRPAQGNSAVFELDTWKDPQERSVAFGE